MPSHKIGAFPSRCTGALKLIGCGSTLPIGNRFTDAGCWVGAAEVGNALTRTRRGICTEAIRSGGTLVRSWVDAHEPSKCTTIPVVWADASQ